MHFREKLMFVIFTFIIFCCTPAVRDPKVYRAEIDFMEAAATEQVERGITLIGEYCTCESVGGVRGFVAASCQDLAETILVVQYRMKYHTEFMRYLGGVSTRRPPKDPPEVPDTNTLCPDAPVEVPVRDPKALDDLPDGGLDG